MQTNLKIEEQYLKSNIWREIFGEKYFDCNKIVWLERDCKEIQTFWLIEEQPWHSVIDIDFSPPHNQQQKVLNLVFLHFFGIFTRICRMFFVTTKKLNKFKIFFFFSNLHLILSSNRTHFKVHKIWKFKIELVFQANETKV